MGCEKRNDRWSEMSIGEQYAHSEILKNEEVINVQTIYKQALKIRMIRRQNCDLFLLAKSKTSSGDAKSSLAFASKCLLLVMSGIPLQLSH